MQRAMLFVLSVLWAVVGATAQGSAAGYDAAAKVFRLDGGNVTYAFGLNRARRVATTLLGRTTGGDGSDSGGGAEAGGGIV